MKRKQREESEAGFDNEEGDEDDDDEEGATPPPAKRTNVFRSPDKLSDDKMERKRRSQEESVKKNKEDKLKKATEDSNMETTSCESSGSEDKMVEGEMEGGKKKSSTPVKEHSSGVNIKVVEVTI